MEVTNMFLFNIDYDRNDSPIVKRIYNKETWNDVIEQYNKIKKIIQTISFEDVKFMQLNETNNIVHRYLIPCDESVIPEERLKRTFKILLAFYQLYDLMAHLGIEVRCFKGVVYVYIHPMGFFISNNFPNINYFVCDCNNNSIRRDLVSMTGEYKNIEYTPLKRIELYEKAFQYMCNKI